MSSDPSLVDFDVLIVGAGLSGIGAACHLGKRLPGRTYTILESRGVSGGTWDLFHYPGIRSDSDMFTLGYSFKPWTGRKSIADGESILRYLRATAAEHGVEANIRYHHRVVRSEWSSADSCWTVTAERTDTGDTARFTCRFLMSCSGYYRYDDGYVPQFDGTDQFAGEIIHPQHWPEDLDVGGKRVVVIGSGATAVTLVPSLAADGASVTMLQRSPTYIVSLPAVDRMATGLRRLLPSRAAYAATRFKNVALSTAFYQLCRRRPETAKRLIRKGLEQQLPAGYDIDTHFRPRYNPWDQRLCLVPDGDLFKCIRQGQVSVATDRVATFTEKGIRLGSGAELDADIVVTATGLQLLAFGGMDLVVDGSPVSLPETMAYKAVMLSGVPNYAFVMGYTNASWTLKADLSSEYVCRLLRHMYEAGYSRCVPVRDLSVREEPFIDFASGYVQRSIGEFPKQGSRQPWKLRMNYYRDLLALRHRSVTDEAMSFS